MYGVVRVPWNLDSAFFQCPVLDSSLLINFLFVLALDRCFANWSIPSQNANLFGKLKWIIVLSMKNALILPSVLSICSGSLLSCVCTSSSLSLVLSSTAPFGRPSASCKNSLFYYACCISLRSSQDTTSEGVLSKCWCSLIQTLTTSIGIRHGAGATKSWLLVLQLSCSQPLSFWFLFLALRVRVRVRVSFARLFQATDDGRFEGGLFRSSSGKFRIFSASNQISNQIENYGSQWLSKIEWKIFRSQRIGTTFRPFSRDSSSILRIPITLIRTRQQFEEVMTVVIILDFLLYNCPAVDSFLSLVFDWLWIRSVSLQFLFNRWLFLLIAGLTLKNSLAEWQSPPLRIPDTNRSF